MIRPAGRKLLLVLTLLCGLSTFALQPGNPTVVLKIAKDRPLFAQVVKPSDKSLPTFVLFPGVNRSVFANEQEALSLIKKGFGVVTFNFSTQPPSVAQLDNETPYFRSHEMSLKDLSDEAQAMLASIKNEYGLDNVIPVSLSFSGSVSPALRGFPLVIETVPMTSAAAANPQLEQYRQMLKASELWNPIFGPGITRASLDAAYRSVWTKEVDSLCEELHLASAHREDMVEGYTAMSRAIEGFSWDNLQLPNVRRVFILAANENKSLLRHQVETFLKISGQRKDAVLYLMEQTGHVIPAEQPEVYANILEQIWSNKIGIEAGVITVNPETKAYVKMTGLQATLFLKNLIK